MNETYNTHTLAARTFSAFSGLASFCVSVAYARPFHVVLGGLAEGCSFGRALHQAQPCLWTALDLGLRCQMVREVPGISWAGWDGSASLSLALVAPLPPARLSDPLSDLVSNPVLAGRALF